VHSAIPMETQATDTCGRGSRPESVPASFATARAPQPAVLACLHDPLVVQCRQPRTLSVPQCQSRQRRAVSHALCCQLEPRRQSLEAQSVKQNTSNSATKTSYRQSNQASTTSGFPQLLAQSGTAACISVGTLRRRAGGCSSKLNTVFS
jgi:hypothetical protein